MGIFLIGILKGVICMILTCICIYAMIKTKRNYLIYALTILYGIIAALYFSVYYISNMGVQLGINIGVETPAFAVLMSVLKLIPMIIIIYYLRSTKNAVL